MKSVNITFEADSLKAYYLGQHDEEKSDDENCEVTLKTFVSSIRQKESIPCVIDNRPAILNTANITLIQIVKVAIYRDEDSDD